MSVVVGIDASLTGTAICVAEDGKVKKDWVITTDKKGVERLCFIEKELISILNHCASYQLRINLCIIEGYSFASRGNALIQMGELGGIIRKLLYELNISYLEITPQSLKKFATGKVNSKKDEVMLQVYKKWGHECTNSDQADAYVLAKMAYHIYNQTDEDLNKYQIEALIKPRIAYQALKEAN